MYFTFDRESIREKYPILSTEADCIIDFFSLDLVKDLDFGKALYAYYPDVYDKLFESFFRGKLNKGNILPYRRLSPVIIHIPTKDIYNLPPEEELVYQGLLKFSQNYRKLNIKTVAIQETKFINRDLINNLVSNLDFPDIMYYEQV